MGTFLNYLGLFGGRFDPVHRAHLAMATATANQLMLNEINWIITGKPVHKKTFTTAEHRLNMVTLALKELGDDRMKIDSRELVSAYKGESNATYKTLESLKLEHPQRKFVWILGEDQFLNFEKWQEWQWLIQNMTLAICSRPNQINSKKTIILEKKHKFLEQLGAELKWIKMIPDSCSSTKVRKLVANGSNTIDLVSASVKRYILENKLYKKFQED